jgi:hypothetical protein
MSITRGTLNKAYVSALDGMIEQRDIASTLLDVANDSGFLKTMRLFGRTKKAKAWEYHQFVNTDMFPTLTVGTTSGSGSTSVTTALTAGNGFIRKGDLVKFPDDKVGYVYSVSTTSGVDTLVIKSVNGDNLTLASGNALVYNGDAVGEGSTAVTNRNYDVTKQSNLIQIFRETHVVTDVEKITPIEFEYKGQPYYSAYQHAIKIKNLMASVDIAMIGGKKSVTKFGDGSPVLIDDAGNPIQTTGGLDEYVSTSGINDSLASTGVLVDTDLADFASQLNAAKAPLNYMGYTSDATKIVFDTFFKLGKTTSMQSVRMNIDNKTNIDMTVDQYRHGTRTYELIPLSILDHPKLLTPSIKGSIYWIPKDKVATVDDGVQPRIQIRYKDPQVKGGDGMIGEWHTGALAPVPQGDQLIWGAHWVTYQGLECLGVNHFAKQKVIF